MVIMEEISNLIMSKIFKKIKYYFDDSSWAQRIFCVNCFKQLEIQKSNDAYCHNCGIGIKYSEFGIVSEIAEIHIYNKNLNKYVIDGMSCEHDFVVLKVKNGNILIETKKRIDGFTYLSIIKKRIDISKTYYNYNNIYRIFNIYKKYIENLVFE